MSRAAHAAIALLMAACGASATTHGQRVGVAESEADVEEVALGRVVVYRNGVAYYERRARVTGDELVISVPRQQVDDFLKSLTVVDGETGEPMPVAFSRQEPAADGTVQMYMRLPAKGTDLVLTYVTESPAWKPSYRVTVDEQGDVLFEGWAIVDNTSGEDWREVYVGVGSSSALSFRYDLWSVRNVQRATLAPQDRFAVAPPTAVTPTGTQQTQRRVAVISDEEIPRPETHPDYVETEEATFGAGVGGAAVRGGNIGTGTGTAGGRGGGRTRATRPATDPPPKQPDPRARWRSGDAKLQQVAEHLKNNGNTVVISGYSGHNEHDGDRAALDRANLVRNKLIERGVDPAQIEVENRGHVQGRGAGVELVETPPPAGDAPGRTAAAPGELASPVGESHFESDAPMTVARGTSVMVSVVRAETDGEVVYLYDPISTRGNDRYAFRAIRMRNPTDSTLETGPVTVYGDNRFVGEGFTEPVPPEATAVIPFALDRQIVVERNDTTRNRISSLQTLRRGILTTEVQHLRETQLEITNRMRQPTKVYVRHAAQRGWELVESPNVYEKVGASYLFEVELGASETKTVTISEATPMTKTIDLRSGEALNMVSVYLRGAPEGDEAFRARMKSILATHEEIAAHHQEIASLRQRLADYRERMDELHGQIVSLRAVKNRGPLMRHLDKKMRDISDRVQKGTMELVDLEEKLMLARVRFQDAVAELTLEAEGPPVANND